jgi:phosphatidylglycerol lysyltransferase
MRNRALSNSNDAMTTTTAIQHTSRAPTHEQRRHARDLVMQHGWNSMAYQILNPGMEWWFSEDGQALVGYAATSGYWVVAGAPICAPERLTETAHAFEATARRCHKRVCYFGAQGRLAHMLTTHGPEARLVIGAQPVWQPAHWDAIVTGKSSLRAQLARARNKAVRVSTWPAERATNHPELRRCLNEWLHTRGLPPMHFLVEPDTLTHLNDRRVFVAERAGRVVGFLVASPVPLRHGWLIEQIIRGNDAPNGTAELLLDAAMRAMTEQGAEYVTLGLSPLSRHGGTSSRIAPWTRLLLMWTRAHGRRFYNFDGLDHFKAKFQPDAWEPIYVISNERLTSIRTIYAIAEAFSGRSPVVFVGAALLRAAWQEIQWSWRKLRAART